jgi:hypothetical protein
VRNTDLDSRVRSQRHLIEWVPDVAGLAVVDLGFLTCDVAMRVDGRRAAILLFPRMNLRWKRGPALPGNFLQLQRTPHCKQEGLPLRLKVLGSGERLSRAARFARHTAKICFNRVGPTSYLCTCNRNPNCRCKQHVFVECKFVADLAKESLERFDCRLGSRAQYG